MNESFLVFVYLIFKDSISLWSPPGLEYLIFLFQYLSPGINLYITHSHQDYYKEIFSQFLYDSLIMCFHQNCCIQENSNMDNNRKAYSLQIFMYMITYECQWAQDRKGKYNFLLVTSSHSV